jgi:hypothetical protein
MKKPTVTDCLDEIRRLRLQNERLKRLVETNRPELDALRSLVSAVRSIADNLPLQMEHLRKRADAVIGTSDDLPRFGELSGILGDGKDRVDAAIDKRKP